MGQAGESRTASRPAKVSQDRDIGCFLFFFLSQLSTSLYLCRGMAGMKRRRRFTCEQKNEMWSPSSSSSSDGGTEPSLGTWGDEAGHGGQVPPVAVIRPTPRASAFQTLAAAVRSGAAGDAAGSDAATSLHPPPPPPSSSASIPIPRPPRTLEPGGWVAGDDVGETPPGVTRAASETLEAALAGRVAEARLGRAASRGARTTTATEAGSSAPGTPAATPPPPSPPPPPPCDGLYGGEASWWAAASGAVFPAPPPPPPADGRAAEPALWAAARAEAAALAADEPVLASTVHACILAQPDLPRAVAAILCARLGPDGGGEPGAGAGPPLPSEREAGDLLAGNRAALAADVAAAHYRTPDSLGVASTLLFHAGLHALAAQRLARSLWWWGGPGRPDAQRRRGAALALQARASAVLGCDAHPAATFGPGVLLAHPMGTVVGEAAVVGAGCVLGHAVTLGGTGKEVGDRHPKLGPGVLVGPHATILGNIAIGAGARIAAAAMVVSPVAPGALVAGNVGRPTGVAVEMGWDL
jgi:serine O-acetyltransferase